VTRTAKWLLGIATALLVAVGIVIAYRTSLPFPSMTTAESWALIIDGGGATIALVGLGVVWYQLWRHRIERRADSTRQRRELEADHDRRQKQATIEYLSRVRLAWVEARRSIRKSLGKGSINHDRLKQIEANETIDEEIRGLCGALEELAVGVNTEVFDRDVVNMMCGTFLIGVYDDFEMYVKSCQKDMPTCYTEFESLVDYLKRKRKPGPGPKVQRITDNWPQE
jgi:hypothetical protein